MSIKIGYLLVHLLWKFKDFNGYKRKVESFLWLNNNNKKKMWEWERFFFFFFLDPWLNKNVLFDSKSGLPPMSLLGQATYGFEAYEFKNPTHKWFAIQSLSKGDIVVWSKVAQMVWCYRITFRSNSFFLFRPLVGLESCLIVWQPYMNFFWQVLMPNVNLKLKTNGSC